MKRTAAFASLQALLLCTCGHNVTIEPLGERNIGGQKVRVEEIRFQSGKFKVVGELRLPVESESHPAIIMVHGSGSATRDGAVPFTPLLEIFLRNGYAVFSWDKPGSGTSTGAFDEGYKLTERAAILADGIEVLAEHPAIDSTRFGLWGISQAGWVMPLVLDLTDKVAFMIVVSGGGEDSIDPIQGAEAYEAALEKAGNQDYQIEVIPGVAHVLMSAKTGCLSEVGKRAYAPEYLATLEVWLQHLSQ